jgi:serine/threonine protein kinase
MPLFLLLRRSLDYPEYGIAASLGARRTFRFVDQNLKATKVNHSKKNVFISYARDDEDWMKVIRKAIDDQEDLEIDVWTDVDEIRAGENIDEKVANAVKDADVAILLVSKHFAESEYIRKKELRKFRVFLNDKEVELVPVPIAINKDTLEDLELGDLLAAVDLGDPLKAKPTDYEGKEERDRLTRQLDGIVRHVRRSIDPTLTRLEHILDLDRYTDMRAIWRGDETCVYLVEDKERQMDVAVKVLNQPAGRRWFYEEMTLNLEIPNLITLFQTQFRRKPNYCVMRYIKGPTLQQYVTDYGMLDCEFVESTLLKIGRAIHETRKSGTFANCSFDVTPTNILIRQEDHEPFLALSGRPMAPRGKKLIAEIKNRRHSKTESVSAFEADLKAEANRYLVPEQFMIHSRSIHPELSDQYLLGLIGYYMLTAEAPPVTVEKLQEALEHGEAGDEGSICRLFDETRLIHGVDSIRGSFEHITPIIGRMTAVDPATRFPTLEAALAAIENPPLHTLKDVRDSYNRCVQTSRIDDSSRPERFLEIFYKEKFFKKCPEAQLFFEGLGEERWHRQLEALKYAVLLLLVYFEQISRNEQPSDDLTVLTHIARQHDRDHLDVKADWYEPFIESLAELSSELDSPGALTDDQRKMLRKQWLEVLRPGAEYIKSRY